MVLFNNDRKLNSGGESSEDKRLPGGKLKNESIGEPNGNNLVAKTKSVESEKMISHDDNITNKIKKQKIEVNNLNTCYQEIGVENMETSSEATLSSGPLLVDDEGTWSTSFEEIESRHRMNRLGDLLEELRFSSHQFSLDQNELRRLDCLCDTIEEFSRHYNNTPDCPLITDSATKPV